MLMQSIAIEAEDAAPCTAGFSSYSTCRYAGSMFADGNALHEETNGREKGPGGQTSSKELLQEQV